MNLLGFKNVPVLDYSQSGDEPVDVNRHMHIFYIYSDLIQPVPVGHDSVPLLRTVDVPHQEKGEVITRSYNNPHYLPLRSNDIDVVEVNITSGSGELVHFNAGTVIVKLHFRQKSPLIN